MSDDMKSCEAIQEQLSAYLDGELTQQDSQRVDVHLRDCERCRATLDDFRRLRSDIRNLDYPEPTEDEWSKVMARLTIKATRGVGWLLWLGGAVVLAAYGLYSFLSDPTIKALERVSVLAIILGVVLLFLTVLAERIGGYRDDKYKDVEK